MPAFTCPGCNSTFEDATTGNRHQLACDDYTAAEQALYEAARKVATADQPQEET